MNKYANPEMIAEALAAGQSAESIAEAMTKALNDAIAEQKAKDEKAKQKARIKDAEDIAVNAMVSYVRVMFEVEGLDHLVSEKDWESLRAEMSKGWHDVYEMLKMLLPMAKMSESTPAATDPLKAFLHANGL